MPYHKLQVYGPFCMAAMAILLAPQMVYFTARIVWAIAVFSWMNTAKYSQIWQYSLCDGKDCDGPEMCHAY